MRTLRTVNLQSGAVSLFMVIFAMLLMTVVTISFLRIMTDDQRQATNNDLAQSAYDSALAGVEDAKRALLRQQQVCAANPGSPQCTTMTNGLASTTCNAAVVATGVVGAADYTENGGKIGEIKVQQTQATEGANNTAAALDQAYTCVTIKPDTDDYIVPLPADESRLIPLISTGTFQNITLEWTVRKDVLSNTNPSGAVHVEPSTSQQQALHRRANWQNNRPALLRAQLVQAGDSFSLGDTVGEFDYVKNGQSNANTLFLYPTRDGLRANETVDLMGRDTRRQENGEKGPAQPNEAPTAIYCKPQVLSDNDYACSATIRLPEPIEGNRQAAFLRLTGFYRPAQVRITMVGTQFKAVQPVVDSTGRANDLFRRVESRIDLYDTSFPYPDAAVDVNGNFCKDFSVTDVPEGFSPSTNCTP